MKNHKNAISRIKFNIIPPPAPRFDPERENGQKLRFFPCEKKKHQRYKVKRKGRTG